MATRRFDKLSSIGSSGVVGGTRSLFKQCNISIHLNASSRVDRRRPVKEAYNNVYRFNRNIRFRRERISDNHASVSYLSVSRIPTSVSSKKVDYYQLPGHPRPGNSKPSY